jgi:hypothetical protein
MHVFCVYANVSLHNLNKSLSFTKCGDHIRWKSKDLQQTTAVSFKWLSEHSPGVTEENHEKARSQCVLYFCRDSNMIFPKHKSQALPLKLIAPVSEFIISMYVQRNIKARYRNHCCRGNAISITYSECV